MAPRNPIALLTIVAVIAGCGGPSDAQRRADQERYVRAASDACTKVNGQIAGHRQRPKDFDALRSSMQDSRNALADASAELHRLRDELGDAASTQIVAFDRALDPFVQSLEPITLITEENERERAANQLRRRGDALYRAAQAAKLGDCGRGGNAIADRALFLNYRDGYIRADQRERRRLRPLVGGPTFTPDAVSINARMLSAIRANYASTGRLKPPSGLRRLHQEVRRRQAAVIRTREQLAPFTSPGQAGDLPARLRRQTPAFFRVERQLRIAMNR
ncbi:MAG: hypothetical protein Q8O56_14595 [Solirubrobacteraceae bacterium]|nr:hypothetical protein [Solirubrobacteraceae bacterium]